MTQPFSRIRRTEQGFALVVIAALFIALAVIGGAAIERSSITAQIDRQQQARAQLSRIADSLTRYYALNTMSANTFPCPARYDLATNHADFGSPILACQTGGTTPVGVDLLPTRANGTSPVLRGMVPFRVLADYGLSPADAIDPWNNRIMYVVHRDLTAGGVAPAVGSSGIEVNSFVGAGVTGTSLIRPDFVLFSYGPDAKGAYPKARTSITVPCATTASGGIQTANNLQDRNCADAVSGATAFATGPAFTTATAANATYFDDIVAYGTRDLSTAAAPAATGGTAYCWGWNNNSQVGDGTTTNRSVPTAVTLPVGVSAFTAISAFGFTNCGIGNNSRPYCWGINYGGRIGDGTSIDRPAPTAVTLPSGVTSFTAIGTGGNQGCGIGNNGRAYCWGENFAGQIGDGTTTNRSVPTAVTLPSGVTSFTRISVGDNHICGIGDNGVSYCWGSNSSGEIGDGTTGTNRLVPTPVTLPSGVTSFTSISAGYDNSCGIGNNGRAYCWGNNDDGQIGDGTTGTNRLVPTAVTLPSGVTSFTAVTSGYHSCGIGNNGRAYCWGENLAGQIGDGTTTNRTSPRLVTLPSGVTSFTAIHASSHHTCGKGNNDATYCWGQNSYGQIGDGTTTNRSVPTAVTLPSGVTSFIATSGGGVGSTCGLAN